MDIELSRAMNLREKGKHIESNELLMKLIEKFPNNAFINYQCAWSFDIIGEETKAIPYYKNAIKLGLPAKELQGAFLGLGSTYRTIGEYKKSKSVFAKGMELFPKNRALQTFYAMTLYNLSEHDKAMELLLNCIIDTTNDAEIMSYRRAIKFYSDKLDEKWID
ncbi:tetratricopeptide repeat protein [Virgibacillus dokdonensis]|uniref:Tetratricopeptide repeat protein n=1 Tax=Virgibacillus dokdonensis TaxID=302167 RepID=A0ABU7VJ41_9BACI